MRPALRAALLLGLVAAITAAANPTPAIVNGQNAPRGRFRYMASLRLADRPDVPFCGGTLIHPRVVLTAGHCMRDIYTGEDLPPNMSLPVVRIGGYNRTTEAPGVSYQQFQVQETKVNPNFKTGFTGALTYDLADNDAALLLLPAPCTLPTVTLVGPSRKPALPAVAGTVATVVGWGLTGYQDGKRTTTGPLQMVQQTLLKSSACQEALGEARFVRNGTYYNVDYRFSTNAMICAAGHAAPPQTTCAGDSGGPLLVTGADASKDRQIGIVSWDAARCDDEYTTYTDIGMVFDWIDAQVFAWTGDRLAPWLPCNQGANKGCKTCAAAPNAHKCASCANPTFVVDAAGKCVFKPVTGKMLADNRAVGFYRQPITYNGSIGEAVDIVSAAPFWMLNGRLTRGSQQGTRALGSVSWSYDNKVDVAVIAGRMVVNVNGRMQKQGPVMALASQTKCHFRPDRCYGGGMCDSRRVDIVRPGISTAITQPFVRAGKKGRYAAWLEVAVTLKANPKQQLTGYLGQTILFRP